MKKSKLLAAAAITSLLAMGALSATNPALAKGENEKCYGVAKAGKNDCQTSTHACAGHSKEDGDKSAWIYVPAGTCGKIVGGSTSAS